MRIQRFEVLNGLLNEGFIRPNQVVASDDSMQRSALTRQLQGVLAGIDDACVAASREYNHSLTWSRLAELVRRQHVVEGFFVTNL